MTPLTARQEKLLVFLRTCGRAPSYQEMRKHLGLAAVSSVHRLILALEARGFIERKPGVARCIRVLDQPRSLDLTKLSDFSTADLLAELSARGLGATITQGADA